jgi:2-hydroxychromene-2-carboxylate isomerase
MTDVAFHFDVMCPWAYQTSKWIREVRDQRDLSITWRFFSLEESKHEEGRKHPWERPWTFGWSLLRVAALVRRDLGGNDSVERFYETAGRMLHEEGVTIYRPPGAEAVLRRLGWDPGLVEQAIGDPSTNDDVRAEHDAALAIGVHGVPMLVVDGEHVLFGPVMTPAPTGEAAARLWDAVMVWTEFPHVYELQRPKLAADNKHISTSFEPFRNAGGGQ